MNRHPIGGTHAAARRHHEAGVSVRSDRRCRRGREDQRRQRPRARSPPARGQAGVWSRSRGAYSADDRRLTRDVPGRRMSMWSRRQTQRRRTAPPTARDTALAAAVRRARLHDSRSTPDAYVCPRAIRVCLRQPQRRTPSAFRRLSFNCRPTRAQRVVATHVRRPVRRLLGARAGPGSRRSTQRNVPRLDTVTPVSGRGTRSSTSRSGFRRARRRATSNGVRQERAAYTAGRDPIVRPMLRGSIGVGMPTSVRGLYVRTGAGGSRSRPGSSRRPRRPDIQVARGVVRRNSAAHHCTVGRCGADARPLRLRGRSDFCPVVRAATGSDTTSARCGCTGQRAATARAFWSTWSATTTQPAQYVTGSVSKHLMHGTCVTVSSGAKRTRS